MAAEFQDHRIKPVQLLSACANVLHRAFIDSGRVDAKRRFRELSEGRRIPLVELALDDDSVLQMQLQLDHRYHQGGFNFSGFRRLLGLLLYRLGERLEQAQPDLALMNDDGGRKLLFHIPAVETQGDSYNILVLGVDLNTPGVAVLQLMYMDPSQYRRKSESQTG